MFSKRLSHTRSWHYKSFMGVSRRTQKLSYWIVGVESFQQVSCLIILCRLRKHPIKKSNQSINFVRAYNLRLSRLKSYLLKNFFSMNSYCLKDSTDTTTIEMKSNTKIVICWFSVVIFLQITFLIPEIIQYKRRTCNYNTNQT